MYNTAMLPLASTTAEGSDRIAQLPAFDQSRTPSYSYIHRPAPRMHHQDRYSGAGGEQQPRYDPTRAYGWPPSKLSPELFGGGLRQEYSQPHHQDILGLSPSFPSILNLENSWDAIAHQNQWDRSSNPQMRSYQASSDPSRLTPPGSGGSSPENTYHVGREVFSYNLGSSQNSSGSLHEFFSSSPPPEATSSEPTSSSSMSAYWQKSQIYGSHDSRRRQHTIKHLSQTSPKHHHSLANPSKKLFHCTYCDRQFTRNGDLRRHEQTKHHTLHVNSRHNSTSSNTGSNSSNNSPPPTPHIIDSSNKSYTVQQVQHHHAGRPLFQQPEQQPHVQTPSRPLARKCPDPKCNTVSRLDNLPKHVERRHPEVWRAVTERNPHAVWYMNCVAFCRRQAGLGVF
ncbi:hypothetical protein DFH27DRAFT_367586 [Peziza echinospora]|nr:hypothetical protein DFH27DRAFT_367586 [Peziza echinospora]